MRKIVEVENKDSVTPAADWDEEWVQYEPIIKAKQNSLADIGCVEFVCKHIQEIDDEDILEETFIVCITLLIGGNYKCQTAFYEFFLERDPQNIFM